MDVPFRENVQPIYHDGCAFFFFLARALTDFLKSHKSLSQVLEMFVLGVASIFSHYILICVYPLALAAIKSSQFY